jgi:large subunit ribosomal protein L4
VRGGGRKPFAQKHTGNARQGSIRNPHYVGGGVVFGPKPNHNYAIGTNAKIVKLAVKSAFSLKLKTNAIYVLDDKANTNKPSTKVIANLLKSLKVLQQKTLFIFNNENAEKLIKSAKNIYRVVSKKAHQVSARDLMHANLLVIQASALKSLVKVVS